MASFMKKCKICNLTKELTEFSPAAKYKDKQYYRGECKACNRIEQQLYGKSSQEKYRHSEHGRKMKYSYKKRKKESDPFYRLQENLRRRIRSSLEYKNWRKSSNFNDYIGCDRECLLKHFESKFTEGMTWENQGKWHIDHIIPLSSATSEEELYKLCHYTNLQPLWASDNIKKSNKISEDV